MTNLTKHGEKRLRKRGGIPKRIAPRLAEEALLNGKRQKDFKGAFRGYLDKKGMESGKTPIVYRGQIYFFVDTTLITMFPIPGKYREAALK